MIIFVDSSQIQVFYKSYTCQYQTLYKCFAVSVPELSLHHVCRFIQKTQVIVHIQSNNFAPHRLHATHPQETPWKTPSPTVTWVSKHQVVLEFLCCCLLRRILSTGRSHDLPKPFWSMQDLNLAVLDILALLATSEFSYDIFHPIPAVQHW